jgi:hypothetical protein
MSTVCDDDSLPVGGLCTDATGEEFDTYAVLLEMAVSAFLYY